MTIPAKALTVLTLGLSMAAATLPAWSQQAAAPDRVVGRVVANMDKQLNLSPQQKARMTIVVKSAFVQRRAVESNAALSPDQKRAKGAQIYAAMRTKAEAILTSAQRQKLKSLRFATPQGRRSPLAGLNHEAKLLNLTPQQTTRMKAIAENAMSHRKAIHNNAALQPDQKRAKIMGIMKAMHAQMDAVLTPAQRQKVAAMRQQRMNQMQGMHSAPGMARR